MEEEQERIIRIGLHSYNQSPEQLEEEGYSKEDISIYLKEASEKISLEYDKKAGNILGMRYANINNQVMGHVYKKRYSEATEVLVEYLESQFNIYTTKDDKATEIWIYDNGIYIPNGKSIIKEEMRKALKENYSLWLYGQVISKIEADTFIEPTKFFNNDYPNEIPLENGILDISKKEVKEFTPKKIFFNKLPIRFNQSLDCPKIDRFLGEVLAKPDDKQVFYELAGFGLLKDYKFEKAFMLVGNGRNGKGKTIELLKRMVGPENCASIPLISMTPDNFCVSELFGKLFNLAGDLSSTALKDTGMFKMLTGRDFISANRKNLRHIHFQNYAKFVFACNELPRVYDYSAGFWDRWVLLEFPYKFVPEEDLNKLGTEDRKLLKKRDEDIINKITTKKELSGLLNKALEGLDRLTERHKFSYTTGTDEIKNTWIRRADSFMAFCLDCLEESFEDRLSKKDLRKAYSKYCKKYKLNGVSDKSIKATLQELWGITDEYITVSQYAREWVWEGIKFRNRGEL